MSELKVASESSVFFTCADIFCKSAQTSVTSVEIVSILVSKEHWIPWIAAIMSGRVSS